MITVTEPTKMQTLVGQRLPQINPELARAPEEKVHAKAQRVISFGIWILISTILLGGGCIMSGLAFWSAMQAKQPIGFGLMFSVLVPIIPGGITSVLALLKNDPDAGGVIQQLIALIGSAKDAIKK